MSRTKKLIVLGIVVILAGAFLYFALTTFSNPSGSHNASNPYTSLTLRSAINETATLDFGDTEYDFKYPYGNYLSVSTFIESPYIVNTPHSGDVYKYAGIEIYVSKVGSDWTLYTGYSYYIVILVKPTIQNYMASLHYTELNLTLGSGEAYSINSSSVNETLGFYYPEATSPPFEGRLEIKVPGIRNVYYYDAVAGNMLTDWDLNIKVFKVESEYMVIYVKPLY